MVEHIDSTYAMRFSLGMERGTHWRNYCVFLHWFVLQKNRKISHFARILFAFFSLELNRKCSVARFAQQPNRKNTHTSFVKVDRWIGYYFWPIAAHSSESVPRTNNDCGLYNYSPCIRFVCGFITITQSSWSKRKVRIFEKK